MQGWIYREETERKGVGGQTLTQRANSQTLSEGSVHLLGFPYMTITADLINRAIDRTHAAFFLRGSDVSGYISCHLKYNGKDGGGFTGPTQTSNKV